MNAIKQPSHFAVEAGTRLRRGNIVFEIVSVRSTHLVIEHSATLARKLMKTEMFWEAYNNGILVPYFETEPATPEGLNAQMQDAWKGIQTTGGMLAFSEKARTFGLRLIAYINAMRKLGHTSMRPTQIRQMDLERLVKKNDDPNPPKLSTLYTCERKIERASGDLQAAFPHYAQRGGGGKSRLAAAAQEAYNKVLAGIYKDKNAKVRFTQIQKAIQHELNETHGAAKAVALRPSLSTVTRETKRYLGAYDICRRNEGLTAAKREFREWYPRDRASFTGQVTECDDKDTGVFAVDELTGLPFGRVWVTSMVDQLSDVPTGLSMSAEARSLESAVAAVINGVMPKLRGEGSYAKVKDDIPYMGRPGLIIFDNARYNHTLELRSAAVTIANAAVEFAKPRTPTEKAKVENFNGRMVGRFLEWVPGFVGPKKQVREMVKEGLHSAVLTTEQFRLGFMKWAYDVHCHEAGMDGYTPKERYIRGMEGRRPRLPTNVLDIKLAGMREDSVQLRPVGVQFSNVLKYHHALLRAWRVQHGNSLKVIFRYSRNDLNSIWVLNPVTKLWLEVPSAIPEYTRGLTLFQHTLITKMARERRSNHPDLADYLKSRQDLIDLTAEMRKSTKLRHRKVAMRMGNVTANDGDNTGDDSAPTNSASKTEERVMTALEAKLRQIDEVELDKGGDEDGWAMPDSSQFAFS
ncbi:hypothetical protein [Herbaspirillum sp. alder98]|uniref:hypothetical protein n=1 Tax=Herbaspirillum sp. alder98 TaxID=2913096 RepID=UPI001CD8CBEC|nr:hypothetical protein [Herbaspirillum sp. alder98]MCA1325775.1 hypothetical protein [Herbaspirillum sp. alder98]